MDDVVSLWLQCAGRGDVGLADLQTFGRTRHQETWIDVDADDPAGASDDAHHMLCNRPRSGSDLRASLAGPQSGPAQKLECARIVDLFEHFQAMALGGGGVVGKDVGVIHGDELAQAVRAASPPLSARDGDFSKKPNRARADAPVEVG